jgi:hypothetical protein
MYDLKNDDMTTSTLKQELHKKIDSINDNAVLEAIYTILNQKASPDNYSLSSAQLDELDARNKLHDSGKATYHTMAEMRKKVLGKKKK